MIELKWKRGGFCLFDSGEKAVARVEVEMLQYLAANSTQMDVEARDTFVTRLGELLTKIDATGLRRTFDFDSVSFATGR